jgi:hypothetical protein
MQRLKEVANDPVQLGFYAFTLALVVQAFHQVEHVVQIWQKDVLRAAEFRGLLGQWFDFEWLHFLYNASLFTSVLAVLVIYLKNPGIWRRSAVGHYALVFATAFQGYHLIEHVARMQQYLASGSSVLGRGLLGQVISVIELHFWLNTIIISALVVGYLAFRPNPRTAAVAAMLAALAPLPSGLAMPELHQSAVLDSIPGTVALLAFAGLAAAILVAAVRMPRQERYQWSTYGGSARTPHGR